MPEFNSQAVLNAIQKFVLPPMTGAYLLAAYWTGDDDDMDPDTELSDEAVEQASGDCRAFALNAEADIAMALLAGVTMEGVGHDLWLTRNGHGTGFWDRAELDGGLGERLSAAAQAMGQATLYAGDDGLAYFC